MPLLPTWRRLTTGTLPVSWTAVAAPSPSCLRRSSSLGQTSQNRITSGLLPACTWWKSGISL